MTVSAIMPPLPVSSSLTSLSSAPAVLSSIPPSIATPDLSAAPTKVQEENLKPTREIPRNVAQLATDAFEEQQYDVGVSFLDSMRSPLWMPSTAIIHALFFLSLRSIPHDELYPSGRARAKPKVPLSLKISYTPPSASSILSASALLSALGSTHGASKLLAHLPYARSAKRGSSPDASRRNQAGSGDVGGEESDEEMPALGSHIALATSIWALLRGADAGVEVRKPTKASKKARALSEDKDGPHPELEEGRWRTIAVLLPMWREEREEKERTGELSFSSGPVGFQPAGKEAKLRPKTHLARQFTQPFPSADVGEALEVAVRGLEYVTAAVKESDKSGVEAEQSLTAMEHKSLYDRARTASGLIGEFFALSNLGQLDKGALAGGLVERLDKVSVEGWIVLSETLAHTPQGQNLARTLRDLVGDDPALHISGSPPPLDLPGSLSFGNELGDDSTPLSKQLSASALGLLEPSLDYAKALMPEEYQDELREAQAPLTKLKEAYAPLAKELRTYESLWVLEGAAPAVQARTTPWAVGEEENYLTLNLGKRGRKVPQAIVAKQFNDTSDEARKLRATRRVARDIMCQLRAAQIEAKLRYAVIKWSVVRALRDDFERSSDEAVKETQRAGLDRTMREITASIVRAAKESELCIAEMEADPVGRRITGALPDANSQDPPPPMRPAMVDAIAKSKRFCAALRGIADAATVLVTLPLGLESPQVADEEEEELPPPSQPLSIPPSSQQASQQYSEDGSQNSSQFQSAQSDAMTRLAAEKQAHLRMESSSSAMEVDDALAADALELQDTMAAAVASGMDSQVSASAPNSAIEISQVLRRTTPTPPSVPSSALHPFGTPSSSQAGPSSRPMGTPSRFQVPARPGTPIATSSQASAFDAESTPSRRRPTPRASVNPRKRALPAESEAAPAPAPVAAPSVPQLLPAPMPAGVAKGTPKATPSSKVKKLVKQQKLMHWFSPSSSSNAGSSQ